MLINIHLEETWHDLVNVLDVVEVLGKRVVDVDGHHFPVRLALINHSKDSQDLHFEDGAPEEQKSVVFFAW